MMIGMLHVHLGPGVLAGCTGSKNCDRPRVLRQTMADTYPSIEWFTCATVQGKPVLTPITDTLEGYLHPG